MFNKIIYENEIFKLDIFEDNIKNMEFIDCKFYHMFWWDKSIINCDFVNCTFIDCQIINPKIENSQIKYSNFFNCKLVGILWQDFRAKIKGIKIIEQLKNCSLEYNYFGNLKMVNTNFEDNKIYECSFENCDLKDCKFRKLDLQNTKFKHCNLTKTDFRKAKNFKIDITDCKLKNAKFSYPDVIDLLDCLEIVIE